MAALESLRTRARRWLNPGARKPETGPRRCRPNVEALEDRRLMAGALLQSLELYAERSQLLEQESATLRVYLDGEDSGLSPTGAVMFLEGDRFLGVQQLEARDYGDAFAEFTTPLGAGRHQVTAWYLGDNNFAATQSDDLALTVFDYKFEPWADQGGFVQQIVSTQGPEGLVHLFGIGGDNALWFRVQRGRDAEEYTPWASLGGYVKQIAVGSGYDGSLTVFAIGGDNAAWFRRLEAEWDRPTLLGAPAFTQWQSLGGYVKQLAVAEGPGGDRELYAIGGDNALWAIGGAERPEKERREEVAKLVEGEKPEEKPTPRWVYLGGYVKQIAVGTDVDGLRAVFGIGGDNALWFRKQQYREVVMEDEREVLKVLAEEEGPSFTQWQSLGGYVTQIAVNSPGTQWYGYEAAARLAKEPYYRVGGGLEIYAIGGDNAVWVTGLPYGEKEEKLALAEEGPGKERLGWVSLGGFVKHIAVSRAFDGSTQLVAIGGDNAAYVRRQRGYAVAATMREIGADELGFEAWARIGGYVKQLSLARNANQGLSLFGIGGDNAAWLARQD